MLDNLSFIESDNVVQSYVHVAEKIKDSDRNKKFLIVHEKVREYIYLIANIFNNYEIIFKTNFECRTFLDSRVLNLVFSLLDIAICGKTKEQILNFLNSYPHGFNDEELWEFKNYFELYQIYNSDFDFFSVQVANEVKGPLDEKVLKKLNNMKKKINEELDKFIDNINKFGCCDAILHFVKNEEYYDCFGYKLLYDFLKSKKILKKSAMDLKSDLKSLDLNCKGERVELSQDFESVSDFKGKDLFFLVENPNNMETYRNYLLNFNKKIIVFYTDRKSNIESYFGG